MPIAPLLSLTIALATLSGPPTSQGSAPTIQPATYRSPSGEYELNVGPTRRDGGGSAQYRMSRSGKLLWEKELYVSLRDAGLTDEGRTAGYAYLNGPPEKRALGTLHIVLLDATGEPIFDEVTQRASTGVMHSSPLPIATQLFVEGDLVRVRFVTYGMPNPWIWRTYRISNGDRLADWYPESVTVGGDVPFGFGIGQHPARESMEVRTNPAPRLIRLEQITTTELVPDVVLPVTPFREVRAFRLNAEAAIEFVRGRGDECAYVTLSKTGDVVAEQALPNLDPANGRVTWYPGHDDTWFAAVRDWDDGGKFQMHRVNVRTGQHKSIRSFSCPTIHSVVSTNDGGFVLLGTTGKSTSLDCMIAVDAADNVLWRQDQEPAYKRRESELFAVEDLARTKGGFLLVLSTVRDSVQVFTASGEFVRFIDLKKSWGHEPRYASRIVADERGGFCVEDDNKLWRMTIEGELLRSWKPESSREAPFPISRVRFGDDGTLWNFLGDLFVSRNPDGTRGASFGTPASEQAIERPNRGWVDRKGHVYIRDSRGGAWHVFDSAGETVAILTAPEPYSSGRRVNECPTLGAEGHWYVPLHHPDDELGHYEFSSSGEPLRHVQLGSGMAQMCGSAPGAWCVVKVSTELALVNEGKTLRELARRPDRFWFRDAGDIHVSADGSTLAVLDGPRYMTSERGSVLCLYDGAGNPQLALDLPDTFRLYRVATSGRWAVATSFSTGVLLIDLETNEIRQVELAETEDSWRWSFSPDGRELWGVESSALKLHRFALPAE